MSLFLCALNVLFMCFLCALYVFLCAFYTFYVLFMGFLCAIILQSVIIYLCHILKLIVCTLYEHFFLEVRKGHYYYIIITLT